MSSPTQTKRSSFVGSQESEYKDPVSNSENNNAALNRIARNIPPLSRILDDAKRQLHFLKATLETLQRNNDESELMKGVLIKYVKQARNGPLTGTPNDIHVFFYYYGGGEIGVILFSEKERYTQWKSFQTSAFGKQAFNLSRQIYCLLFNTDDTSNQANKLIDNEVHEETNTLTKSPDEVDQNGAKVDYADSSTLPKPDYSNSDKIVADNECVYQHNHKSLAAVSSSRTQKISDHDVNQPSPTPSSPNESSETVSSMSPDRREKEMVTSPFRASQSNLFEMAECSDDISKSDANLDNCDSLSDSKVSYSDNLDSRFEVIMEDSLSEVPYDRIDATDPSFVAPLKFSINLRDSNQGESNCGTEHEYEPLKYLATEKMVEMPIKKKRGRPRKHPLPAPHLEPNRSLSESHTLLSSEDPIASSQRYLLNHGAKSYCCNVCSKTFPDISHLRRHERNRHNKLG